MLQRKHYSPKVFDSGSVHRDVRLRKDELRHFNKTLADFGGDTHKYNAYLELVEDLATNLRNGVDLEATRAKIRQYVKENQALIKANATALATARSRERKEVQAETVPLPTFFASPPPSSAAPQARIAERQGQNPMGSKIARLEALKKKKELHEELFDRSRDDARPVKEIMADLEKLRAGTLQLRLPDGGAGEAEPGVTEAEAEDKASGPEDSEAEQLDDDAFVAPLFVYSRPSWPGARLRPVMPPTPDLQSSRYTAWGAKLLPDPRLVEAGGHTRGSNTRREVQLGFACLFDRLDIAGDAMEVG